MHYIYFLWSEKLRRVYIGETRDFKKRFNYHNSGLQRYTKKGCPWILLGFRKFPDKITALKEEKRLKRCRNKNYYKQYLIDNCLKLRG